MVQVIYSCIYWPEREAKMKFLDYLFHGRFLGLNIGQQFAV